MKAGEPPGPFGIYILAASILPNAGNYSGAAGRRNRTVQEDIHIQRAVFVPAQSDCRCRSTQIKPQQLSAAPLVEAAACKELSEYLRCPQMTVRSLP